MADLSAAEVKGFFDRVASQWDAMRLSYYDERVIDRMAAAAQVDRSMVVADVGTGTGFVAAGMAPRVGRVIGVDTSAEMLAVARQNLAALGIENVDLLEGDAARLPLGDDSVDAAFANMVLHHAEDPAAMLAEMKRAVRPGGTVAVCDEVEHPYEWMRVEHADVWLGFTADQITRWCSSVGLEELSLEALGMQ